MKFWHWLRADWGYKLLSLFLAALLWMFVLSEQNPFKEFALELRPIKLPLGMVPIDVAREVKVVVHGPRHVLENLTAEGMKAYYDAEGLTVGKQTRPIQIDLPPDLNFQGAQVRSWEPREVMVTLDRWVQEKVPVAVSIMGDPQSSYTYDPNPILTPEQIMVSGPSQVVDQVTQVQGEVSVNDAQASVESRVLVWAVDLSGRKVENVNLEPSEVQAQVRVNRRKVTRLVQILPHVKGIPATGFEKGETSVSPSEVNLIGDPSVMGQVEQTGHVYTQPVNVAGETKTLDREVSLDLPQGVEVADDPSFRVQVQVGIQPIVPESTTLSGFRRDTVGMGSSPMRRFKPPSHRTQ